MNKAQLLFKAYKDRKEIEPFNLTKDEAIKINQEFVKMLIQDEGLGGYKIAKVESELMIGYLTKPMITNDNQIELWFKNHKLEVEIVALVEQGKIKKTFLGLEIPATRFTTWNLPPQYMIADNLYAARLYVGPEIKPPYGNFKLYINDKLVGEGEPKYNPEERVKDFMNGYVTLGVFIGPIDISRGDEIRVEGKTNIRVKTI